MTTRTLRVALAGNPNSGKTSIFNALTGAHQRVGNYPGVTVERREGRFVADDGQVFEVLDLPGTYSLSSYSPEERIAQEELLKHGADVIALVVDSTALERSLVLVTQLLQLGVKPVLCLNMADEAKRAGQELDLPLLEKRLGFPVIETVAHRAIGVAALRSALARVGRQARPETPLTFGDPLDGALARITEALEPCQGLAKRGHPWIASRLLADDPAIRAWVLAEGDAGRRALTLAAKERHVLEAETGVDTPLFLMQRRQAFVQEFLDGAIKKPARADARHISDAVDRVLVNRVLGLPIFLAIMYGLFWITFTVGEIPMKWIEHGTQALAIWVSALWPLGSESVLRSLLVDGAISGVSAVLIFVPNIVLLFWGLSLLENTGYMARAAFLMDRVLHRFGLHGRSFLPLITGFGCSIPGIMATRTLENEKDRLTTILVLPLMSCGARLAVWMLLVPTFFAPAWRAPVLWGIYLVGILLALGLAFILRRAVFRGDDAPFVMELPPYRLPSWKNILDEILARTGIYLRKAATVILAFSIVLWAASNFPKPSTYRVDAQVAAGHLRILPPATQAVTQAATAATSSTGVTVISHAEAQKRRHAEALRGSIVGHLGRGLEGVFAPLGFDWRVSTAIVGAFAVKEVFVAQLAIVYALDSETQGGTAHLREAIARNMTPLAGISLILFLLIATPCMATVAIVRRETGSWRWPLIQFFGLTAIAYLLSLVVYQVGKLIFPG